MMNQQSTAILFFSRTALQETKQKTLVKNIHHKKQVALFDSIINHSLSTLESTQLPLFTCFSQQQIGHSFGERLANAIENVYNAGYEKVIVLGNDSPQITKELILKVAEDLNHQELILGPNHRGGLYLIALDKRAYHRQKFINLAWENKQLQASFNNYIQEYNLRFTSLKHCLDLNFSDDFNLFIKSIDKENSLFLKIFSIIYNENIIHNNHIEKLVHKVFLYQQSLRAPPTL